MLETFIALLSAHVLADFLLQMKWIIRNKQRAKGFGAHALIVAVTAAVALGMIDPGAHDTMLAVTLVTVTHGVIDAAKLWLGGNAWVRSRPHRQLNLFLADQAAHLAALGLIAALLPAAWHQGYWASSLPQAQPMILTALCVVSGFILTTRASGFAIRFFMLGLSPAGAEQSEHDASRADDGSVDDGLTDGGAWIGLLERTLIFVLVLLDQYNAIGFLIAAKSILRFQYAKERHQSEIVIIGTLASFTCAILFSWLTVTAIELVN